MKKQTNPNSLANLKPFKKGETSGSHVRTGRPPSLALMIQKATKHGQTLMEGMLSIADGSMIISGEPPRHQDRIRAVEWLADRGFGKAVETVLTADASGERLDLAREVARQLMARRAQTVEAGAVVEVVTVSPGTPGPSGQTGGGGGPVQDEDEGGGEPPPDGGGSHDILTFS